jgi:hypothetical protein
VTTRLCSFPECEKKHKGHGLCQGHLVQRKRGRDLTRITPKSDQGRTKTTEGYVRLFMPRHPSATKSGHVKEHRYVMELHLGRPLAAHENVHHKNGVKDDNRLENLELWVTPQPAGQRLVDLIDWMMDNYQDEIYERILK